MRQRGFEVPHFLLDYIIVFSRPSKKQSHKWHSINTPSQLRWTKLQHIECLGPYGLCHPGNNCKTCAKAPATLNAHSRTIDHDYVKQATRGFSVTEALQFRKSFAGANPERVKDMANRLPKKNDPCTYREMKS